MQLTEGSVKAFTASEALAQYRRVKLTSASGTAVEYADAGEDFIGITQNAVAINKHVSVILKGTSRTYELEFATTMTQGDDFYGADDGKGSSVSSGPIVGKCLETLGSTDTVSEVILDHPANTMTRETGVPLHNFMKTDLRTVLAAAGDGTNLGIVAGTHGTNGPSIQGTDAGGTTATEVARMLLQVPDDYAEGDLTFKVHGGILTTVSDGVCTADLQVYEVDKEAGLSSDLCETAAQSINSTTLATKSFVIDGDDLQAGDILDVEITVTMTDTGNAGAMVSIIGDLRISYTAYR